MADRYKAGTKSVLVRMPGELKDRLENVAAAASKKFGNVTATSIARQAIEDKVNELEKELGIPSPEPKKKR